MISRKYVQVGLPLLAALASGACSTTPTVPISETARIANEVSACGAHKQSLQDFVMKAQSASKNGVEHVVVERATGMRCGPATEIMVIPVSQVLKPGEVSINNIKGEPQKFKQVGALGDKIIWSPEQQNMRSGGVFNSADGLSRDGTEVFNAKTGRIMKQVTRNLER